MSGVATHSCVTMKLPRGVGAQLPAAAAGRPSAFSRRAADRTIQPPAVNTTALVMIHGASSPKSATIPHISTSKRTDRRPAAHSDEEARQGVKDGGLGPQEDVHRGRDDEHGRPGIDVQRAEEPRPPDRGRERPDSRDVQRNDDRQRAGAARQAPAPRRRVREDGAEAQPDDVRAAAIERDDDGQEIQMARVPAGDAGLERGERRQHLRADPRTPQHGEEDEAPRERGQREAALSFVVGIGRPAAARVEDGKPAGVNIHRARRALRASAR